jgi:hypothetical protein
MTQWRPNQRMLAAAQKWRDFADTRRDHYLDIYRSGRWSALYTEEQFILLMRDVLAGADRWADIAPRPALPAPPRQDPLPRVGRRRTAA